MIPASTFSADALLAELIDWVRIESPTYDAATVNRMEDFIAPRIEALGFAVERLPGRDGFGDILRCRRAGRTEGPGILMIAHADTVHPVGTLADKLPIRRQGDKCFGPAIYDMKGGTVIALAALKAAIGAMGIATLDGLGVMGGGAHTHEEHILVSSLVPRATLLARLIAELD